MPRGAGNVIILGADPAKHANYRDFPLVEAGAQDLINAGIAYAAAGTDGMGNPVTGAYICLSQYFYRTVRSCCRLKKSLVTRVIVLSLQ